MKSCDQRSVAASSKTWRDSLAHNDSNSLSQLLIEVDIAIFLSDLWIL